MKVIFLEDNLDFAKTVISDLQNAGHEVNHTASGKSCLKAMSENQYDLALFDWEIPDISGEEVFASIKISGSFPPVIFLTARDSEEDVVSIIESGADDYIVKPHSPKVLIARINAAYRRANPEATQQKIVNFGNVTVDNAKRQFMVDDAPVKLTEKEISLALYFFSQIGVLLSKAHITKVVWGTASDIDTRTIDVHVSHLRTKLKLLPQFGWRLVSVYNQGYRLERL
ncbi:MAG TPA: response regulator transcription factor [Methylophilaceae bacterium]|jgi:DNA-binding response OmpR family regulator